MSRTLPSRSKPAAALLFFWAFAAVLGVVMTIPGGAQAPPSNPFDAEAQTPTPVTPGAVRSGFDIGPIREVGPRIREALDDDDERSDYMHLVEDPHHVLSDAQASELADDTQRLTAHGIPAMFIIRESARTREEAAIDADQLRVGHTLETAPGADDGILFLVTQPTGAGGSRASRQSMFLTISYGAHTLPKGGLNEASLREVQDRYVRPRMRFGLLADALRVGIRKIIYLETYLPDPSPPLTALQSSARSTLGIAAPVVSIAGLGSVVASWRRDTRRSRWRPNAARHRYVAALALAGVAVSLLAMVSVYSQSRPGIIAVLVSVAAIAAHSRLLRRRLEHPRRQLRVIRASSRRSQSRQRATGRTHAALGSRRSSISATPAR